MKEIFVNGIDFVFNQKLKFDKYFNMLCIFLELYMCNWMIIDNSEIQIWGNVLILDSFLFVIMWGLGRGYYQYQLFWEKVNFGVGNVNCFWIRKEEYFFFF